MDQKKIRFLKGLSTAMVVAAMVFAFLIAGIRIFGVQVYGVLTGSMEPSYPTGSLIYVKPVDAADLRLEQRKDRPFTRQELALLFTAMLTDT